MTERNLIFVIADKQGRPTMRTRRQSKVMFMEAQGWSVINVIEDSTPLPTVAVPAPFDNRNLCNPALRLGSL